MLTRRKNILEILKKSSRPIKGEDLGEKLHVTRQVIVQDIAILRAEGSNIIATNRGYMIPKEKDGMLRKIVSEHETAEEMEDELNTIVDFGGVVKDVIIDHQVYGQLKGSLEISNRKDVSDFMKEIRDSNAEPLSRLTEGVHMHTIEVEDEDMYLDIESALKEKKYLTK